MKDFILDEGRRMWQFQKRVLKALVWVFRCTFWILPWIVFLGFAIRPFISGAREAALQNETAVSAGPVPRVIEPEVVNRSGSEDFQSRIDSGIRTVERLMRNLRRT